MKRFLIALKNILSILMAASFLLMSLNIMLYYGFQPSAIHSPSHSNPFNLDPGIIWIIHLITGFFAGMVFSKKQFLLTGLMGFICAAIITGVSFFYFGWRTSLISVEAIIPLIVGIIPTMKLYDFLKKRIDGRKNSSPAQ